MSKKIIRFGVIGCGLMGREFASAAARWCHLMNVDFEPQITAACDVMPQALEWFQQNVSTLKLATTEYAEVLASQEVDAVYVAVPHNQHAEVYVAAIQAGKHLFGEKPFGIDLPANEQIMAAVHNNPQVLVRGSSEFPFYPAAYRIQQWIREKRFGKVIDMEVGFWHSSDLDPLKQINWKRRIATNGEYGCMGDLGMHALHIPFRFGWQPHSVRALLAKIVRERPDKDGKMVPCETWDNAILACDVITPAQQFPMLVSYKRIAPGNANTWFIKINGTELSAEFSTKNPKELRFLPYTPGGVQEWHVQDMPYQSAYPTLTGHIFEFGFTDSILQMWAAFCDELVHGEKMLQPFGCVTPEETFMSHRLFTAALVSQDAGSTVIV